MTQPVVAPSCRPVRGVGFGCAVVRTSCCVVRTSCRVVRTSCRVVRTSCRVVRTSCCVVRTSCCVVRTSCRVVRTSCHVVRTSCIVVRTSCIVVRTAVLSFVRRAVSFVCRALSSGHGFLTSVSPALSFADVPRTVGRVFCRSSGPRGHVALRRGRLDTYRCRVFVRSCRSSGVRCRITVSVTQFVALRRRSDFFRDRGLYLLNQLSTYLLQ